MHCSALKNWPIFGFLEPEFVSGIHMVMVYGNLGNNKALIVMKNRKVYSLGEKCESSLEINNCDNTLNLREVEALSEKNVKTFACGSDSHILALTENGEIYFWCDNERCNHNNQDFEPRLEKILGFSLDDPINHFVDIACGGHHSLVITENGKAFIRGVYTFSRYNSSPEIITDPYCVDLKKTIVQGACGKNFTLVVTKDGEVYGWGNNSDSQLGNGSNNDIDYRQANRINFLPKTVKVVCGQDYALALTDEGKLYAWGENSYGQLGIGTTRSIGIPCIVTHKMGRVSDIVALHSSHISVAVGKNKRIYMWGRCREVNILTPTLTPFSTVYDVFAFYALNIVMHKPLILHMDEEPSIEECFGRAFNDESTSDYVIQVASQPIYVHKAVLKIRSTYFKNMFQDKWLENSQKELEHTQFSYTVYKAFLKYLYTGVVVELSLEEMFELVKLADSYCEDALKRRCVQLMKEKIDVANVIFLYSNAIRYNMKELEEFCFNFVLDQTTEVVQTKDFGNLDQNTMKTFIEQAAKAGAFRT